MAMMFVRERLAALRQSRRLPRVAATLWVAGAVIAWNVVFDHVIVVAGRRYLHAAGLAVQAGGAFARLDDWMRPAVTAGVWTASASAAAILAIGMAGVRLATARTRSGR